MIDHLLDFLLNEAPKYAQAFLMLVGGLGVVARYTPWKWDDRFFRGLEAPAKAMVKLFPRKKQAKRKPKAK